jgi:two-component system LytT family sensor kinase
MKSTLLSDPGKRGIRARYFLAWTAIGLFYFSQSRIENSLSHNPRPWWSDLATWMSGMYICAALTPAILWLGHRFPIERTNWLRRAGLHLLFSVVFSVVELAVHSAIIVWLRLMPAMAKSYTATFLMLLGVAFQLNIVTYWFILGISRAVRLFRKYQQREKDALLLELNASELETRLARAQMRALKAQLQPHFLFNTLNAVMVLVRQQKARDAEETLTRLSDLLRCVLEDVEAQEVPLRRELEFVQLYLSIEQVRFQDRLRVGISAEPGLLEAAVPHMLLQPIVENAIRHGIGRSSAAGRIEIAAARVGDSLRVEVRDDGPGLAPAFADAQHGIGLANTRARLRQLYGDAARLTLENAAAGGAVATAVLPYHAASGPEEIHMVEANAPDNITR